MNFKSKFTQNLDYVRALTALTVLFYLLSLAELFINFSFLTYFYRIISDSLTAIVIGLLFFPIYLILKSISLRFGIKIIKILFALLLLIQLGLIGYSLTTNLNLGADLLGYSMSDMYITVTSSVNISFLTFLPSIILILVYYGLIHFLNKFQHKINISSLLLVIVLFASLTFFVGKKIQPLNKNKLYFLISDIVRGRNDKVELSDKVVSFENEFPLEKPASKTQDVLAPFFTIKQERPNIIFVIIEGLGSDFVDQGEYAGFTPYLDSLTKKSLYWRNFVSNAGRTFGALPSLMGSLPFGENGFMELNPIPKHQSLISILKSNGYETNYYCGDDSTFDRKINFLEYNGIDNVIDVFNYGSKYKMTAANSGGFSWGYPDAEIYRKALDELKDKKNSRLDIIMTLTNHEPFNFPSKKLYLNQVDKTLSKMSSSKNNKFKEHRDIFACLLYTDNSLRSFMKAYSKRADYANTIFVITGDHRLIPVPQKNDLARFHVPFYIYSPLLKKTSIIKSISSHVDVAPSLMAFLTNNYKFNKIEKTTWISEGLDTVKEFRSTKSIPLMRYKGSINDYIYQEYFFSDGNFSKIDENFNLTESGSSIESALTESFLSFKKLNAYLTSKDKITSELPLFSKPVYEFTAEENKMVKTLTKGLTQDEMYFLARKLAFDGQRKKSKLLCNFILNDLPNYGDVRTLKGRVLAWEGDYVNAEKELLEAINRTPFYNDSYLALMDVYYWSEQNSKSIEIGERALKNQIDDPEIAFKLAEAFLRTNKKTAANKLIDSLIILDPKKIEYLNFKKSIKK